MKLNYLSTLTPKFKHEVCEGCTFHGSLKLSKSYGFEVVDIYTCDEFAIVRFGDEPQDNKTLDLDMINVMESKLPKLVCEVLKQDRKPEWNNHLIRERLLKSDKWVVEGVIRIFEYQTAEEQNNDITVEDNGVGFNGLDAELLSSYAKFAIKSGFLTSGQMVYARKKMLKYAGQLAKIANSKRQIEKQRAA